MNNFTYGQSTTHYLNYCGRLKYGILLNHVILLCNTFINQNQYFVYSMLVGYLLEALKLQL